jgi:GxxExxY protein
MNLSEPSARADELAYKVIGAAIDVHRALGPGLPVEAYQRALMRELAEVGLKAKRGVAMPVEYKGHVVGHHELDIVVEDELVVEVKAVDQLLEIHRAELISHLQAAKLELGLLINFNVALLKDGIRRVVRCKPN